MSSKVPSTYIVPTSTYIPTKHKRRDFMSFFEKKRTFECFFSLASAKKVQKSDTMSASLQQRKSSIAQKQWAQNNQNQYLFQLTNEIL